MTKRIFQITEPVSQESLPIEKLVETMCHMESTLEEIRDFLENINAQLPKLSGAIEKGIEQAVEGMKESGWVKLHMKELVGALNVKKGEEDGLPKEGGS